MLFKSRATTNLDHTPLQLNQPPRRKVRGTTNGLLRKTFRILQAITAIVTIGIYSSEIPHRSTNHSGSPVTDEIYALVVGLLSIATLALHHFVTGKWITYFYVLWDLAMSVLWAALAGRFGTMYLDGAEANEGSVRSMEAMRAAVTFDIFGVVFWFVAFVVGCVGHCLCRRTKGQDHQFDETANMETGLVRLEDGGAESSDEKGNLDGRAMHGDEKSGK